MPLVAKAYIAPVVASGNKTVSNGEEVPGQETCARCANQVFLAERKQAAGKVCVYGVHGVPVAYGILTSLRASHV